MYFTSIKYVAEIEIYLEVPTSIGMLVFKNKNCFMA